MTETKQQFRGKQQKQVAWHINKYPRAFEFSLFFCHVLRSNNTYPKEEKVLLLGTPGVSRSEDKKVGEM